MATTIEKLWSNPDPKNYTEVFKFNGWKFRIHIAHTNGDACGFNYKCSLSVMKADGTWGDILDNRMAGVSWANMYIHDKVKDKKLIEANNKPAIDAFKKYVKAVYA